MMHVGLLGRAQPDRLNFPRNVIRNSTMQGGLAGTPGTVPTNWSIDGNENGLTRTLSYGREGWIDYVDVRVSGTTTAGSTFFVTFESNGVVAATEGERWSNSAFLKLEAGSLAGITNIQVRIEEFDGGGAYAGTTESADFTPDSVLRRYEVNHTIAQPVTAFIRPNFRFSYSNATEVDVTFRIGLPQVNQASKATPTIRTLG